MGDIVFGRVSKERVRVADLSSRTLPFFFVNLGLSNVDVKGLEGRRRW